MRLNVKRLSATILAAGLVFGVGACSDDEDDDTASGDTDTEATQPDGAGDAVGGDEDSGDEDSADDGGGAGGGEGITIADFAYSEATVGAGATIPVTNEDGAPHTVTSDDDAFEEVSLDGGASGELTAPSEPGEYPYHCDIHPQMTGTLVVE